MLISLSSARGAFLFLCLFLLTAAHLTAVESYRWLHPQPTGQTLTGLAHGKNVYVAVGGGRALLSENGADWETVDLPVMNFLHDVVYADSGFYMAGDEVILHSEDGYTWTVAHQWQEENSRVRFQTIATMGGEVIAAGYVAGASSAILARLSTDGDWERATASSSEMVTFGSIAQGNDTLLLLGLASPYPHLYTLSSSGSHLQRLPLPLESDLYSLVFAEGKFFASGADGRVWSSFDGSEWQVEAEISDHDLVALFYGENGILAVEGGIPTGEERDIFISENGTDWIVSGLKVDSHIQDLIQVNGKIIATGDRGRIYSGNLNDGLSRQDTRTETAGALRATAYGKGTYVAVGGPANAPIHQPPPAPGPDGARTILVSEDLESWESIIPADPQPQPQPLFGIAFGNETFVAVGGQGTIETSPDGYTWETGPTLTAGPLHDIIYANGAFLAVGAGGAAFYSTDGYEWQDISFTSNELYTVAWDGRRYLAAGLNATLYYTSNLKSGSWAISNLPSSHIRSIASGSGQTILTGGDSEGVFLSSSDLMNWKYHGFDQHSLFLFTQHAASVNIGDEFLAVGHATMVAEGSMLQLAPDDPQWTVNSRAIMPPLYGLDRVNGRLIAVGDHGAIIQFRPDLPVFIEDPVSYPVQPGRTAVLSVKVEDPLDGDLTYRWFADEEPLTDDAYISGSHSATLTIAEVEEGHSGPYRLEATNAAGTAASGSAHLSVVDHLLVEPAANSSDPRFGTVLFHRIQDAIDFVQHEPMTVVVLPRLYYENLLFDGRPAFVTTGHSSSGHRPTLSASGNGPVVSFRNGANSDSGISGFEIRNGDADTGGGILVTGAAPIIEDNLIAFNHAIHGAGIYIADTPEGEVSVIRGNHINNNYAQHGGGIYFSNASAVLQNNVISNHVGSTAGGVRDPGEPTEKGAALHVTSTTPQTVELINNTITKNAAETGGGIYVEGDVNVSIVNTILAHNSSGGVVVVSENHTGTFEIRYSNFWDNTGGNVANLESPIGTDGNLSLDPQFVAPLSFAPELQSVTDGYGSHSPMIAAGDPYFDFSNEPLPNGGRINIGADGNTPGAARATEIPTISLMEASDKLYIARSGPFDADISVSLHVGDYAYGQQVISSPNPLVAPADREITPFSIVELPGLLAAAGEMDQVWLADGPTYQPGPHLVIPIQIQSPAYNTWLRSEFAADTGPNYSRHRPSADPEGAGIPNLLRYAHGIPRESNDRSRLPRIAVETFEDELVVESTLSLSFYRPTDMDDVHFCVEGSYDLYTWLPLVNPVVIEEAAPEEGSRVTVFDDRPVDDTPRFLRLQVELDP